MPPPLAAVRRRRISSDRNDAAAHEQTHSLPSASFSANLPSNEGAERNVQKKKKNAWKPPMCQVMCVCAQPEKHTAGEVSVYLGHAALKETTVTDVK